MANDEKSNYVCQSDFLYRTNQGRYFRIVTTFTKDQVIICKYRENALKVKGLLRKEIVPSSDPRYLELMEKSKELFGHIGDLQ